MNIKGIRKAILDEIATVIGTIDEFGYYFKNKPTKVEKGN